MCVLRGVARAGLVDENGEYDEDAVAELQQQLADANGPPEDPRDSTKHDMIFHWGVFVFSLIVAVRSVMLIPETI